MPKLARRLTAFCLLTTPLLFAFPAHHPAFAQDQSDSVPSRLDRLEQSMNELQRQVYQRNLSGSSDSSGSPAPSGSEALNVQVRMDQLAQQIRDLTGRVEETQYGISQLKTRLDKMQSDDEQRFQALEHPGSAPIGGSRSSSSGSAAYAAAGGDGGPPPSTGGFLTPPGDMPASPGGGPSGDIQPNAGPGPDNPPPPPPPQASKPAVTAPGANASPQAQYSYAFNLLRNRSYGESQAAFNAFLKRHPKDPLAGNAQYWLGETYFAQNQFQQAAAIFAQGYARYPQSAKAPDNLLKLGISLNRIGKNKEACVAYAKLDTYPKVLPATKEVERREKQRAHC